MPYKDPEKLRQYKKEYYQKNKERLYKKKREGIEQDEEKRLSASEYRKEYYKKNKERERKKQNEYKSKRAKTDPAFRMIKNYRKRTWEAYKNNRKSKTTLELLGCSPEELAQHLEKQFQPGMTHDNYGEWHIDHIRPIASFDLSDPKEAEKCFHYTNLQPLWAADNLFKSDSY